MKNSDWYFHCDLAGDKQTAVFWTREKVTEFFGYTHDARQASS